LNLGGGMHHASWDNGEGCINFAVCYLMRQFLR
jgi:hypothetical protein